VDQGSCHFRAFSGNSQKDLAERMQHCVPVGSEHKHITRNPFQGVKVTVPKERKL
jgi:hypothetical protein